MSMIDFVANSKSEGSWCSTSESHVTKMARWVAWGAAMHGMASSLSACCCDDEAELRSWFVTTPKTGRATAGVRAMAAEADE